MDFDTEFSLGHKFDTLRKKVIDAQRLKNPVLCTLKALCVNNNNAFSFQVFQLFFRFLPSLLTLIRHTCRCLKYSNKYNTCLIPISFLIY